MAATNIENDYVGLTDRSDLVNDADMQGIAGGLLRKERGEYNFEINSTTGLAPTHTSLYLKLVNTADLIILNGAPVNLFDVEYKNAATGDQFQWRGREAPLRSQDGSYSIAIDASPDFSSGPISATDFSLLDDALQANFRISRNDNQGAQVVNGNIFLKYDTQTANFTVGQVLTGGTSGATATIESDLDAGTTGTLVLSNVSGVFQDDEIITDALTGSATADGIAFIEQGGVNWTDPTRSPFNATGDGITDDSSAIAAADAAAGATGNLYTKSGANFLIDADQSFTSRTVIDNGGKITVAATRTASFTKVPWAGPAQWLFGTGLKKFESTPGLYQIPIEWFGGKANDEAFDNAPIILEALHAFPDNAGSDLINAPNGGVIVFGQGHYFFQSQLYWDDMTNVTFQGAGSRWLQNFRAATTTLIYNGDGTGLTERPTKVGGGAFSSGELGTHNPAIFLDGNHARNFSIRDMGVHYHDSAFDGVLFYMGGDTAGFSAINVCFGGSGVQGTGGAGVEAIYSAFACCAFGQLESAYFERCRFSEAQRGIWIPDSSGQDLASLWLDSSQFEDFTESMVENAQSGEASCVITRCRFDPIRLRDTTDQAIPKGIVIRYNGFYIAGNIFAGASNNGAPVTAFAQLSGRGAFTGNYITTRRTALEILNTTNTIEASGNFLQGAEPLKIRGGVVTGGGNELSLLTFTASITNITQASPAVMQLSAGQKWFTGHEIYITGVSGMTEVNNRYFTLTKVSDTDYELDGENSTGHTPYSSGGTARWGTECCKIDGSSADVDVNLDLNRYDGIGPNPLYSIRVRGSDTVNRGTIAYSALQDGSDNGPKLRDTFLLQAVSAGKVESKTGNYTVTNKDSGKIFSNLNALGPITFTLPSGEGWQEYGFLVQSLQAVTVQVSGAVDKLYDGTQSTSRISVSNGTVLHTGTAKKMRFLNYDAQTVDFTLGETLTGTNSAATATIAAINDLGTSGQLRLENIAGVFEDDEPITDGSGGAAEVNGVVFGSDGISSISQQNRDLYAANIRAGMTIRRVSDGLSSQITNISSQNTIGASIGEEKPSNTLTYVVTGSSPVFSDGDSFEVLPLQFGAFIYLRHNALDGSGPRWETPKIVHTWIFAS